MTSRDRSTARSTRSPATAPSSPVWSGSACPDADIVVWRVMPSDGPIVESDLVATLAQIAELARRHRAGEPGGHPIDVLSLSMGYYHETPEDALFDPTMYAILEELASNGVVVVCSAGNDATSRPSFPAAFCRWVDDGGPIPFDPAIAPIVSVGALNPNRTDALFSNAGPWVRAYVPGAAVVSTMPGVPGWLRAGRAHTRLRPGPRGDRSR